AVTGAADTAFGGNGVQSFGGTNTDQAYGVAVSGTRVYVTGAFQGSARVGGAGTAEASSSGSVDSFVLSMDAVTGAADTAFGGNGVQSFGGTNNDIAYGVAVSGTRVYVAGQFSGSAQVGGAGTAETSASSTDAFV